MNIMRRVAAVVAATATIIASGLATQSAAAAEQDVYTTPGGHTTNGRLWKTDCEMYSTNVVRCRTDIFAGVVVREGSNYKRAHDFFFNNLTYLPSNRGQWKDNPLATTGTFSSEGRQWRTECDTAATGTGGCRSYLKTKYVAYEGGRYVTKDDFIFNNIVRFAHGSIAPVTSVPADVIDTSRLDFTSYGPLKFGTPMADLAKLDYAEFGRVCEVYSESSKLRDRGIYFGPENRESKLIEISLNEAGLQTVDGAAVGMTVGQIKAIYGTRFQVVTKTNYGQTQYFGSVREGGYELMFRVHGPNDTFAPTRALVDSDVVAEIRAHGFTTDVTRDGC